MEFAGDLRLLEIFMEHAAERDEERRNVAEALVLDQERRKKQTLQEKRERREKEERDEREHAMLATVAQVDAFRDRLDSYDTATVQALMDNGRALDEIRHAREAMEASAYRLPDGRLAFKSDDGKHVFDQHGAELSRETVDPNAIPDTGPRWTAFKTITDSEHARLQERQELHNFQQRVDDTRETLGQGPVTSKALSKMEENLRRDVPKAVGAQIGIMTPEQPRSSGQSATARIDPSIAGLDDPSRFAGPHPAPMPH